MGGIDLCYGRYEDQDYRLIVEQKTDLYPYLDYCNPRIKELSEVRNYKRQTIDP